MRQQPSSWLSRAAWGLARLWAFWEEGEVNSWGQLTVLNQKLIKLFFSNSGFLSHWRKASEGLNYYVLSCSQSNFSISRPWLIRTFTNRFLLPYQSGKLDEDLVLKQEIVPWKFPLSPWTSHCKYIMGHSRVITGHPFVVYNPKSYYFKSERDSNNWDQSHYFANKKTNSKEIKWVTSYLTAN